MFGNQCWSVSPGHWKKVKNSTICKNNEKLVEFYGIKDNLFHDLEFWWVSDIWIGIFNFKFNLKIPLKCHLPIKFPDNGIEFSFIQLKFHQFLITFTYSGVFTFSQWALKNYWQDILNLITELGNSTLKISFSKFIHISIVWYFYYALCSLEDNVSSCKSGERRLGQKTLQSNRGKTFDHTDICTSKKHVTSKHT